MKKTGFRGNIVLPDRVLLGGVVTIEDEKIAGVFSAETYVPEKQLEVVDFGSHYISPGFIDLHLHGALGKDVMDAEAASLEKIALHQARCGVTGFLCATISSPLEAALSAIEAIKQAAKWALPSEILGIYLEGPFINKKKKGAHDPDFIREIRGEDVQTLIAETKGLKTVIGPCSRS